MKEIIEVSLILDRENYQRFIEIFGGVLIDFIYLYLFCVKKDVKQCKEY